MKEVNIPNFSLENGFSFPSTTAFCGNKTAFLINSTTGTSLLISLDLLHSLYEKNPSENFQLKLVQHFLASIGNSPTLCNNFYEIKPRYFMINVTSKCNLRCKYCFRTHDEDHIISKNEVHDICKYISDYCKKHNVNDISIQPWGGEPLIAYKEILLIDDYFKKTNIKANIFLQTNGTLLTKKMAIEFKKRNIAIGFSLDGIAEVNDRQRVFKNGHGTFLRIALGIKNYLSAGTEGVGAISVITPNNYQFIEESIRHLVTQLNIKSIKCNIVKMPQTADMDDFSEQQIKNFSTSLLSAVIKLRKEGLCFSESNINDRLLNLTTRCNKNICNAFGCMGGRKMVSFDSKGNIYPCEMVDFEEEKLGNIHNDTDLIDLIKDSIITKDYFVPKTDPKCNTCPWKAYCKGGCTTALKYKGLPTRNIDTAECLFNKSIYYSLVEQILDYPENINLLLDFKSNGGKKCY